MLRPRRRIALIRLLRLAGERPWATSTSSSPVGGARRPTETYAAAGGMANGRMERLLERLQAAAAGGPQLAVLAGRD